MMAHGRGLRLRLIESNAATSRWQRVWVLECLSCGWISAQAIGSIAVRTATRLSSCSEAVPRSVNRSTSLQHMHSGRNTRNENGRNDATNEELQRYGQSAASAERGIPPRSTARGRELHVVGRSRHRKVRPAKVHQWHSRFCKAGRRARALPEGADAHVQSFRKSAGEES